MPTLSSVAAPEVVFITTTSAAIDDNVRIMARFSVLQTLYTGELHIVNTLKPRQDGRHFPDDILKWIFWNENLSIAIKISLQFVPRGPVNKIPALVQTIAWRRPSDKPLSEPMMDSLQTHINASPGPVS